MTHDIHTDRIDFMAGWKAIKDGVIKKQLTNTEIDNRFHPKNSGAFAQGMLDALVGDNWRYNRAKINVWP